jgi:aspartyl-tRNA(Asn)/glutamyl-tRNA(Gln) amidotransferase subunit B
LPVEDWEAVIGMEVHAQLSTRSKMFCSCSTDYLGSPPNSNVCEVCLGLPGVLPVANRAAVEKVLTTALALGCEIPADTKFDRKNYFYPDLPKGYQISQYDLPMSRGGAMDVGGRSVRITRVHLEEDTGSLKHADDQLHSAQESLVDLNRSGMPLMEVVSEPDLRSAEEARDYAVELHRVLRWNDVSDADMEKGQFRAEANVSVRRRGSTELGVKTELKNINSFRALHRAVEYEIGRQIALLESGQDVVQETRGWSEARQETFSQRSKEYAQDYRYFPEPDLPPLHLNREWIEQLRTALRMPLADARQELLGSGLSAADTEMIVSFADRYDTWRCLVALGVPSQEASNWIPTVDKGYSCGWLAKVIRQKLTGRLSHGQAVALYEESFASGRDPDAIVEERGLAQVSDEGELTRVIDEVIAANPKPVGDYRAGKQEALGDLLGKVRQQTGGRANMKLASELLRRRLAG